MSVSPLPVVFEPFFVAKPWGGQRLAALLGKSLPPAEAIGESWELVSLADRESRVRGGPLAGRTLGELVQLWGGDLLGDAGLFDGRFPLLIKFLDARESLSVQVHPKPDASGGPPGVKHEAWYVIHADPGAKLYVGLQPGVAPGDVARVAGSAGMVDVLRAWDGRPGQCYYLPGGTLHALGAGLVVAEIQTPSVVTYRAYDWNRVDTAGQPRELHVEQALRNIRYDCDEATVRPQPLAVDAALKPAVAATRVLTCDRFLLDEVTLRGGTAYEVIGGTMRVWVILEGTVGFVAGDRGHCLTATRGDVVLIPAGATGARAEAATTCRCVQVTIPPSMP